MIGKRYIDGEKLCELISDRYGTPNFVQDWLKRQPKAPKLIGRQRAAEILGVGSPYISTLTRAGKMPQRIEVEGGKGAYDEAEVKALAAERKREKKKKKESAK